jgi:hypothetical protein
MCFSIAAFKEKLYNEAELIDESLLSVPGQASFMGFRVQFSLRTLLLLAVIVGGGLAFVIMPWQHRQEQLAILERLRNNYGLGVEKRGEEDFYQ